jgi:DNA-binding HxlR family transcriptional regulator
MNTPEPRPAGHRAENSPEHIPSEDSEWAQELTARWVEVYKKSATTLVLLRIIQEQGPLSAAGLTPLLQERTGWTFTERGLYRTLRRLADSGVLAVQQVPVPRTGKPRQDFVLTVIGAEHLRGIEAGLV